MEDSLFAITILPVALAFIILSLGLSLTPADFRRVLVFPRGVSIGLLNLMLISPLLAFTIAELYDLDPVLAVGLVLLGASPGGVMANMLTHLAKGDTALSITMTAISSVSAVITVPLFLGLAINVFDTPELSADFDMAGIVIRVLAIIVIPLSTGMYLRSRSPARVIELEPRVKRIALTIFVAVVLGAVITEAERVLDNLAELIGATLTLNLAAMTIGYTISRVARLEDRQATAIAIELSIHNTALAIAVGAAISTELTIPAAVYSAFMFVTAGLFARWMYRRNGVAELA